LKSNSSKRGWKNASQFHFHFRFRFYFRCGYGCGYGYGYGCRYRCRHFHALLADSHLMKSNDFYFHAGAQISLT
jgi:hypothetical protein